MGAPPTWPPAESTAHAAHMTPKASHMGSAHTAAHVTSAKAAPAPAAASATRRLRITQGQAARE